MRVSFAFSAVIFLGLLLSSSGAWAQPEEDVINSEASIKSTSQIYEGSQSQSAQTTRLPRSFISGEGNERGKFWKIRVWKYFVNGKYYDTDEFGGSLKLGLQSAAEPKCILMVYGPTDESLAQFGQERSNLEITAAKTAEGFHKPPSWLHAMIARAQDFGHNYNKTELEFKGPASTWGYLSCEAFTWLPHKLRMGHFQRAMGDYLRLGAPRALGESKNPKSVAGDVKELSPPAPSVDMPAQAAETNGSVKAQ